MTNKKQLEYRGTGRRKTSTASVRLIPKGKGNITINKRKAEEYFHNDTLMLEIRHGLVATETVKDFDIFVNVKGGGLSGQAGAIKHGIVRALLEASDDYRELLKKEKLLTRDSRKKERKKPGLKSARRAPQFSKR